MKKKQTETYVGEEYRISEKEEFLIDPILETLKLNQIKSRTVKGIYVELAGSLVGDTELTQIIPTHELQVDKLLDILDARKVRFARMSTMS